MRIKIYVYHDFEISLICFNSNISTLIFAFNDDFKEIFIKLNILC